MVNYYTSIYKIGQKEPLKRFTFYRSYAISDRLRVELKNGETQKQHMLKEGFTMLVGTSPYYRELMEQFREFHPLVIYSMWDGYLREGELYTNQELVALKNDWKEKFISLHTSGHAPSETIQEFILAVNPRKEIVPIHTENANGFLNLHLLKELKSKIKA